MPKTKRKRKAGKKKPVDLAFAFQLPPEAAMDYFRSKGYTLSWDWTDTLGEAHARAFTVAHVASMDILQDIRGAVDEAIADGQTFREFRKNLEPTLKKKGWWGRKMVVNPDGVAESVLEGSPRRLRTIYHTNMKSAYSAGREKFFQKNKKKRPYGAFWAILDSKTRDEHRKLHKKTFPLDDPFWDKFTPPLDFSCRCRKRALSAADAKRLGLQILSSRGRMVREERLISEKTGEVRKVWGYRLPGGGKVFPRAGFDNNPFKAAFQPDLEKYDYDIAQKYVEGAVTGPAFKRFLNGNDGGKFPVAVLDPKTRKKAGARSQAVLLSEDTRNTHPKITLKQFQGVQKIVDSATPLHLPDNRIAYLSKEGSKQRLTVMKTTRDKKELYFLSTYTVDERTVRNLKKRAIKK